MTTPQAPESQGWFPLGEGRGTQTSHITANEMLNFIPSIVNYLLAQQTFSISGGFADCLPSDAYALVTACEDNVLLYDNGGKKYVLQGFFVLKTGSMALYIEKFLPLSLL
ncbi:hypothetical protein N7457_004434 [Penicillium paradoxum]|uniref:uncharacterized protein n=1 Tax=Penicillium paradoxum TaxID=176176 RepID=UPI0025466796|nr:uncharacterized protein N7457_004434 [Penicillium paradoxum]KAJ5782660.1 hypothetical protein N7457_004434 [Penicillium paradoxum]